MSSLLQWQSIRTLARLEREILFGGKLLIFWPKEPSLGSEGNPSVKLVVVVVGGGETLGFIRNF